LKNIRSAARDKDDACLAEEMGERLAIIAMAYVPYAVLSRHRPQTATNGPAFAMEFKVCHFRLANRI
jgi:hypothetical protein